MNEKKPLPFNEALFLTILITIFLFFLAAYCSQQTKDTDLISWYYAGACIISLVMFGFSSLKLPPVKINNFFELSLYLVALILIIFSLSWTDIFDGPYKSFCRWPILTIALAIIAFEIGTFSWLLYGMLNGSRGLRKDPEY